MRKNKKEADLIAFPEGKADGIPSAVPNPLWDIRERVLKALGERKQSFRDWANRRRVKPESGGVDDLFFFDEVVKSLSHVTLKKGFRLAARLETCWMDPYAVFVAEGDGRTIPLEDSLCLDGALESYWEAAVLLFETDQFYRFQHANYERREMVPDLRRFLREYSFCGYFGQDIYKALPQKSRWELCKMDFEPVVNPSRNGCVVYYTTFAPFGGFERNCLIIIKGETGVSIGENVIEHVPYRCPIMF